MPSSAESEEHHRRVADFLDRNISWSVFDDPVWHQPSEIIPGLLYLGDWKSHYNVRSFLPECRHIVNVTNEVPNFFLHSDSGPDITYMRCPLNDTPDQNIYRFFDISHDFIENAIRNNSPVLVHCFAGMSRSATIVCAFLIRYYSLDAETALQLVRSKRAVVRPNPSFRKQLEIYHKINSDR